MNFSGSDVTKDAADMILLDDDFASIVNGVEEGRKIFDNLKKTVVYLLTSNVTEIVPFFALLLFNLPLPLSAIFMLIICVGTDIWPALSLAYEEAELDVMTRRPRTKKDHLVSGRLLFISYMQMGIIATASGFVGYFTTFYYLGFPVTGLFGMATRNGFRPIIDDFSSPMNPVLGAPDPFFNS
jgi:sodium/potassium-transporting ATPase subunit alpha